MLRPVAEKLITKARKGDLHNRREVLKTIRDKSVVHTLFTEIAPTFAERPGGYTRITKLGPRKGDNAPMAVIELVTEPYTPTAAKPKKTAKKSAPKAEPKSEPAAEVEKPAEDAPAEVEATDEAGETQVVETEAADVDTAEAQAEVEESEESRGARSQAEPPRRDTGRGRRGRQGRRQGLTPLARPRRGGASETQMRRLGICLVLRCAVPADRGRGGRAPGVRRWRPRPTQRPRVSWTRT